MAANTGLYVPVHKRRASDASSSSSRSSSDSHATPIYTIDALLALAHSPTSRLSLETREALRTSFPDIITNRKQRKTIEYQNNNINSGPRRTQRRPERRRNATKVLDGAAAAAWQRHGPAPLMVA